MKKAAGAAKAKKKKKIVKLSAEDKARNKLKRDHIKLVRQTLRNQGFDRVLEIAEKTFKYQNQDAEFDDAFIYENVLLFVEYTTSQASDIKYHLKNKKITYENIVKDKKHFIQFLTKTYPAFAIRLASKFHIDRYVLKIVYCSRFDFDETIKSIITEPVYLDYGDLKYFEKLSGAIKSSSLPEMLHFLEIDPAKVAKHTIFPAKNASIEYHGSILPEASSGYPSGYKVVSFYADAASLLDRAYVLRRDGWRSSFRAYQRMIQPAKIESIRKKLKDDRRVFVNNLIVTLPSNVHPVDTDKKTIEISDLTETAPVTISLPLQANSIGLIDGQHRLFSYYESRDDDPDIATLRHQQNLLVTGIIYPADVPNSERERFEASLFLAINTNQTNAPTALRQEIEVVLRPFGPTAIGKQVVQRLAGNGPLAGKVENHFFDKGLLKTTSIVTYGLGPLIKLQGSDSLFAVFENPNKDEITKGNNETVLDAYLDFCTSSINKFLSAVKYNLPIERWTVDRKTANRVISVTSINSFLITMRMLIDGGYSIEFNYLKEKLSGIDNFSFSEYHSSQYGRMAERIFELHFKK